jgi:lysophospholipase L1-like esterase
VRLLVAVIAACGFAAALALPPAGLAQTTAGSSAAINENAETYHADEPWIGSWAVSPQPPFEGYPNFAPPGTPPTFSNQTLRQIAHISLGGTEVRVRVSNVFGTDSLVIGAARIGLGATGAQVVPGTNQVLTFSGRTSITIPPGALAVSDPINLEVPPLHDLSISLYLPSSTLGNTQHTNGWQTNYLLAGDQTSSLNPAVVTSPPANYDPMSFYFLIDVEVYAREASAIVCLGDSITDGDHSTPDANHRWPNFLALRLLAQREQCGDIGVLDEGISGNRLLHNLVGPNALARFDRDVIAQAGVSYVILEEGNGDIGFPNFLPDQSQAVSATDIIAAYRQLIIRAHEAGLRIYGTTLTPFAGSFLYSDAGEVERQAVNKWIRTSGAFDGIIDFEAVLRDGQTPPHVLAQYDSGDHVHPNDAGYAAMANAIPLELFEH